MRRERALLAELTRLDTEELAAHGRPVSPQQETGRLGRLQWRARYLRELEHLWEEIAHYCPEAADYVALRRGDSPSWGEFARLATALGAEVALLSLFATDEEVLLFIMSLASEEPEVIRVPLTARDLYQQ